MVAPNTDGMGYMFSCSLDNTVRVWDPYDMMCLRVLTESREELSAMVRRPGQRFVWGYIRLHCRGGSKEAEQRVWLTV
jgi:WD40 repeat protein